MKDFINVLKGFGVVKQGFEDGLRRLLNEFQKSPNETETYQIKI